MLTAHLLDEKLKLGARNRVLTISEQDTEITLRLNRQIGSPVLDQNEDMREFE